MAFAMIYASQQQIDLMTHSAALSGLVAGNETFAHATSAHIEELDSHITEYRTLNAGDYLLHEDDEPENIYLVVYGKFDVLKNNNDALKRFSVAQLGRGECIGDVALLDGGKRSATIQALEPSEVAVIPIKALQKTDVSKGPLEYLMKLNLTRNFAERLRRGNEQVVQALEERERKALHEAALGRIIRYGRWEERRGGEGVCGWVRARGGRRREFWGREGSEKWTKKKEKTLLHFRLGYAILP